MFKQTFWKTNISLFGAHFACVLYDTEKASSLRYVMKLSGRINPRYINPTFH